MYIPKRYGESKKTTCPFCGKVSTIQNSQGVPVCVAHRTTMMPEVKCVCGKWLELLSGKWGPYFRCINCGNVSWNKGREMVEMQKGSAPSPAVQSTQKAVPTRREELVVRSDDPRYFD
ncbi:MAG TPA: hypothetical protein VJK52_05070 [Candidatus Nanoarchaeia archaeon]|nr:hypothetical protein [Candidatus Nanoarchaeia archaeon]